MDRNRAVTLAATAVGIVVLAAVLIVGVRRDRAGVLETQVDVVNTVELAAEEEPESEEQSEISKKTAGEGPAPAENEVAAVKTAFGGNDASAEQNSVRQEIEVVEIDPTIAAKTGAASVEAMAEDDKAGEEELSEEELAAEAEKLKAARKKARARKKKAKAKAEAEKKEWEELKKTAETFDVYFYSSTFSSRVASGSAIDAGMTVQSIKGKTYMDYRAITMVNSAQYRLQTISEDGDYGIRMYDDRYEIAIGYGFGARVGQYVDVELDNGETLPCIVGDMKAKQHTDVNRMMALDGSVVEFVVNSDELPAVVRRNGDVGAAAEELSGRVKTITVYKKWVEGF